MTIRFLCPLGHRLAVPDNRAGKKGRCPVCRQRVYIPRPDQTGRLTEEEIADMLAEPDSVEMEDEELHDTEEQSITASSAERVPSQPATAKHSLKPRSHVDGQVALPAKAVFIDEPGEPHELLDALAGNWKYRLILCNQTGGRRAEASGTAQGKWIMGRRFVQVESQGTLLGLPFNSLCTLGYDNFRQEYRCAYLDNRNTGIFLADGRVAEDGKTLRLFGEMHDWRTGQRSRACQYVICFLDGDSWTLELHDLAQGQRIIEISYTHGEW